MNSSEFRRGLAQTINNLPAMHDTGLIPGLGRFPGEGNSHPIPVFLPGEFHGHRSLADYCSWGHGELDRTEELTVSLSL